ncbi:MAG: iron-sulfur cluster repair di-iron protein [Planctomycetia bacterium]|nr:iron-sulfur cluster repair di-iron protein [Planctomycetia bacterium]
MTLLAERRVGDLVAERPERARVLEQFAIDYCCGGQRSLADACRQRNLSVADVERALDIKEERTTDQPDWTQVPLATLVADIVDRHHTYLRAELPRLGAMLDKVVARHGDSHAFLHELQRTYIAMWEELANHMLKEELVLFPHVVRLEEADASGLPAPRFHCGTVMQPIHVMEDEHRSAGNALAKMRDLTNGYRPPADACSTWLALWHGLEALEADLHLHIHKENNILFPRAAALESSLPLDAGLD